MLDILMISQSYKQDIFVAVMYQVFLKQLMNAVFVNEFYFTFLSQKQKFKLNTLTDIWGSFSIYCAF